MTAPSTLSGPQVSRSLADWATHQLREAVLSGELLPGQTLKIVELADRMSISHTPLREALQRLVAEGLVVYEANKGIRIAPISAEDARDIYHLRLLLEPLALEQSMLAADESWKRELQAAYAALQDEADESLAQTEAVHRAFHRTLVSSCKSQRLQRFVETLADQSARYRTLAWAPRDPEHQVGVTHRHLYEACLAGDVERAKSEYERHISSLTEEQIERLKARHLFSSGG